MVVVLLSTVISEKMRMKYSDATRKCRHDYNGATDRVTWRHSVRDNTNMSLVQYTMAATKSH